MKEKLLELKEKLGKLENANLEADHKSALKEAMKIVQLLISPDSNNGSQLIKPPPVDLQYLALFSGNNKDIEKELFEVFTERINEGMRRLPELVEETAAWEIETHSLRGAASFFGAKKLSAIFKKAEKTLNTSTIAKQALLKKANAEYKKVTNFMNKYFLSD